MLTKNLLAVKCLPGAVQGERGVSSRNFNQPISEFLEVHNFLVVAQTSHQENRSFLKNNGHFPGIWRMAAASILACGVCFKSFFKKSKKYMGPAWAPGVQMQIPDAWASRAISSRAQQHHRGWFVGSLARAPRSPVLLWGCQEMPQTSINPPLQAAGTTYRVFSVRKRRELMIIGIITTLLESWTRQSSFFVILQALEVMTYQEYSCFYFSNCNIRSATIHLLTKVFTITVYNIIWDSPSLPLNFGSVWFSNRPFSLL